MFKEATSCFKVCPEHKTQFQWTYTGWSDCQLRPGHTVCSIKNGIRYRNVTCVYHAYREDFREEEDHVCWDLAAKPETEESCELKCPQDCVMTAFSSWADNNCDTCLIVNRTRTRQLVVPQDPDRGGKPCLPFTEMTPCDNCIDVYTYKIGPWEECIPFNPTTSTKGSVHPVLGYKHRHIHCIDSLGRNASS